MLGNRDETFLQQYAQVALVSQLQRDAPSSCAELCLQLATNSSSQEEQFYWMGVQAYCWGLAGNQRRLTPVGRWFVKANPQIAKQHATNRDMQRDNPLYCAELCQILAEKASGLELANLKGAEAYCLALQDIPRAKACANLFVERNFSIAEQHAHDEVLQKEHPLYCAVLFHVLAINRLDSRWKEYGLLKSAELFLLGCNIGEFRHSLHLISAQNLSGPNDLNVWHFLMRFLSTYYTHASNVLIVKHFVEEALKDPRILTLWTQPFSYEKSIWTGFSLLMDTLYYHWEEISEAAKDAMLSRLALIIPLCREAAVWTEGVSFEGRLLDTPLRLMGLLFNKSPKDDPATLSAVTGVLERAIQNAPLAAWDQKIKPSLEEEEGRVAELFTNLGDALAQTVSRRFPKDITNSALPDQSVFNRHALPVEPTHRENNYAKHH